MWCEGKQHRVTVTCLFVLAKGAGCLVGATTLKSIVFVIGQCYWKVLVVSR